MFVFGLALIVIATEVVAVSATTTTTLAGQWDTYVGPHTSLTIEVDVSTSPGQCRFVSECCDDQFTLCYAGDYDSSGATMVRVTRVDSTGPGMGIFQPWGWGQLLELTCLPSGQAFATQIPADAPGPLRMSTAFLPGRFPGFHAKYRYGPAIGDCACAAPKVQYRRLACPTDWTFHEAACYRAFTDDTSFWAEAQAQCFAYGGHLASAQDDADRLFLASLLDSNVTAWIGHFCDSASCATAADFAWVDKNDTSYLHSAFVSVTSYNTGGADPVFHPGFVDGSGALLNGQDTDVRPHICRVLAWVDWPLDWFDAPDVCTDENVRTCDISAAFASDSAYDFRMQIACSDSAHDSDFGDADDMPFMSLPWCKFSSDSGAEAFECADKTMVNKTCREWEYEVTTEVYDRYCANSGAPTADFSPSAAACDPSYADGVSMALANGLFGKESDAATRCTDDCLYDMDATDDFATGYLWNATGSCWKQIFAGTLEAFTCLRSTTRSAWRDSASGIRDSLCLHNEHEACDDHGGVVRCPRSAPVLCANGGCQRDDGRCTDLGFGGPENCTAEKVPAKAPSIMDFAAFGEGGLTVSFAPGYYASGFASTCSGSFRRWTVQVVETGDPYDNGEWHGTQGRSFVVECARLNRDAGYCEFEGLYGLTDYYLRIMESCDDERLDSEWSKTWYSVTTAFVPDPPPPPTVTTTVTTATTTSTPDPTTTSTTATTTSTSTWFWEFVVGSSSTFSVDVDVGQTPYFCEVIYSCCEDEFSLCYDPVDRQSITITRTDNARDPDTPETSWNYIHGWGQELRLNCVPAWAEAHLDPVVEKLAALPPARFQTVVMQAAVSTRYFYTSLNYTEAGRTGIGDCECAEPYMEYRRAGCLPGWHHFGLACFLYVHEALTWTEAEAACYVHGGHLASVHSDEEKEFVLGLVDSEDAAVWLGHYCSSASSYEDTCVDSSSYIWSDGSSNSYLRSAPAGADGGMLLLHEGDLVCDFAVPVRLTSAEGRALAALEGLAALANASDGINDTWQLFDAGSLNLFVESLAEAGERLTDFEGELTLTPFALPRNEWSITDVGNGELVIQNKQGRRLTDADGELLLSESSGGGAASPQERWRIVLLDETPACNYSQAPLPMHRGIGRRSCHDPIRCAGYSDLLLRSDDLAAPEDGGTSSQPLPGSFVCKTPAEWDFGEVEADQRPWEVAPDDCLDPSRRSCDLPQELMERDAHYQARVQVACLDANLSSEFTYNEEPILTLPPCTFLNSSGVDSMFECADRSLCNMTDDSCCSSVGGIIRCPDSAPVMCEDFACANGTERCCAVDASSCDSVGGELQCTNAFAPAKAPTIMSFESEASGELTLSWSHGTYASGLVSPCIGAFRSWDVEISATKDDLDGALPETWVYQDVCATLSIDATSCVMTGLAPRWTYAAKLTMTCQDRKLDAETVEPEHDAEIRPLPAAAPGGLRCGTSGGPFDDALLLDWDAGDPGDCDFSHWEVSMRLLPRPERNRSDGTFEEFAEGGIWFQACYVATRDDRVCRAGAPFAEPLLSNRDYEIRVQERCLNGHADGPYRVQDYRVEYSAGDRVKVLTRFPNRTRIVDPLPNGQEDLFLQQSRELTGTIVSGPRADRHYLVDLADGTSWFYPEMDLERLCRTAFAPALEPAAAAPYDEEQYSFGVDFEAGDPKSCIFVSWQVQAKPVVEPEWPEWDDGVGNSSDEAFSKYGCVIQERAATWCKILAPLGSTATYDIRIREVCTDPNATSAWAEFQGLATTLTAQRADNVSNFAAVQTWPYMLVLSWTAGANPRDCAVPGSSEFQEWLVELRDPFLNISEWVRQPECARLPREATRCYIHGEAYGCDLENVRSGRCGTMGFGVVYELRIREACTDSGANSLPVDLVAATRPLMTAEAPWDVEFEAAHPFRPPYTMLVSWAEGHGRDCTRVRWGVHLEPIEEYNWTFFNTSDVISATTCHEPLEFPPTLERPYGLYACEVYGDMENLSTNANYMLRIWEECNLTAVTGEFEDGAYSELNVTAPASPAERPELVEVYGAESDRVQVRWYSSDIGDCPEPYPYIRVWPQWRWFEGLGAGFGPGTLEEPWPAPGVNDTPMEPHDEFFGNVTVVDLTPNTMWHIELMIYCRPPFQNLSSNATDAREFNASAITLPGCNLPENSTLNCTPELWPENAPEIVAVDSLAPGTLNLHWAALAYLSGDESPCEFDRWQVEIAFEDNCTKASYWEPAECTEWIELPNCSYTEKGDWQGHRCEISDLQPLKYFHARFQARCTDPSLDSMYNVTKVPALTQGFLAGTPENLTAVIVSPTTVNVTWDAGLPGGCMFTSWRVVYREEEPDIRSHPWQVPEGCADMDNRNVTECSITGLSPGTPISIKIEEECTDPRANSVPYQTPIYKWYEADQWSIYVGANPESMRAYFNVLDEVERCVIEKDAGFSDEFTVCISSTPAVPNFAAVTRADTLAGWGQRLWMNCSTPEVANTLPEPLPANAPAALHLVALNSTSARASYTLLDSIGDCECATLELEVRPRSRDEGGAATGPWELQTGDCADMRLRGCVFSGLQYDIVYDARLRIACSDENLTSPWTDVHTPLAVRPQCAWEVGPTASEDEVQCIDGSFCADVPCGGGVEPCGDGEGACCNTEAAQGVLRCPPSKRMCAIGCVELPPEQTACGAAEGGERDCQDENVPARIPNNVVLIAPSPTSIVLTWTDEPYASAVNSPCLFSRWTIEHALASAPETWHQACELDQEIESKKTCMVDGLESGTEYLMRVKKRCAQFFFSSSGLDSLFGYASVTTPPTPASVPQEVFVADSGLDSLELAWIAGTSGDCAYKAWRVEQQRMEDVDPSSGEGNWSMVPNCIGARAATTCTIEGTDLVATRFRVSESCHDPRADSPHAMTPWFTWLHALGIWQLHVGPSEEANTIEIHGLASPRYCYVDASSDLVSEFALCHSSESRYLTVTRTDRPTGWPDDLTLNCSAAPSSAAAAGADASGFAPVMALYAPLTVAVGEDGRGQLTADYDVSGGLGPACECAALRLQLREEGEAAADGPWFTACNAWDVRRCETSGLRPDTAYQARLQITCDAGASDSPADRVTETVTDATMPGCIWSSDSGRASEFRCFDDSFCDTTDPACCAAGGGRRQCPASMPVMCADEGACADGQDYCCAADAAVCAEFGGPRLCSEGAVPARAPALHVAESLAPASLALAWQSGEELAGGRSRCRFLRWRVELADLANVSEDDADDLSALPWRPVPECEGLDRGENQCVIEGLESMAPYQVRILEICAESRRTSLFTYSPSPLVTRPWPALAPVDVACDAFAALERPNGFRTDVSWTASAPENCTFVGWEVEARLLPQEATPRQPAASSGPWTLACNTSSREDTACSFDGLKTNFAYELRAVERCSDPHADSAWSLGVVCHPPKLEAVEPSGIRAPLDGVWLGSNDSFEDMFEVEILISGHNASIGADTSLVLFDLAEPAPPGAPSMIGAAGLRNSTRWAERDGQELLWDDGDRWALRGDLYALGLEWNPGDPGACLFASWEVQAKSSAAASWDAASAAGLGCASSASAACSVGGLWSDGAFDIRVRQVCTDPDLNSPWAEFQGLRTRPPIKGKVPQEVTLEMWPMGTGLTVTWRAGAPEECVFEDWLIEFRRSCIDEDTGGEAPCPGDDESGDEWRETLSCEEGLPTHEGGEGGLVRCDIPLGGAASALFPALDGGATETPTLFRARVSELCADSNAEGGAAAAGEVMGIRHFAASPLGISAASAGETWLALEWTPGPLAAESWCPPPGSAAWRVGWRKNGDAPGSVSEGEMDCTSPTECNITALERNTPYEVWVTEVCSEPASLAAPDVASLALWTLPGEWEVHIGMSEDYRVEVDIGEAAAHCTVEKECCSDEFLVCIEGTTAAVVRVDNPGGWGQEIKLRCSAASRLDVVAVAEAAPPPGPLGGGAGAKLADASTDSMLVLLPERLPAAGDGALAWCPCASLRLEVAEVPEDGAAPGDGAWHVPTDGTCAALDWSMRRCSLTNLQQTTTYSARVRFECLHGQVSNWTEVEAPMRTINPVPSVGGSVEGEVGLLRLRRLLSAQESAEGRRLEDLSALLFAIAETTRAALATVTRVPLSAAFADARAEGGGGGGGDSISVFIEYEVAIAPVLEVAGGVASEAALSEATGRAEEVAALLAAPPAEGEASGGGATALTATLVTLLGSASSVRVVDAPHVGLRLQAFQPCGVAYNVSWAAPTWSPASCRGRTWSDPPCPVVCAEGFEPRGEGFGCGASGLWEGAPPTCAPQWLTSAWSGCSAVCGAGVQSRQVTCAAGSERLCKGAAPAQVRTCYATEGCEWRVEDWSECSSTCGAGSKGREVWCPTGVEEDCAEEKPSEDQPCYATSGCAWDSGPWSECDITCGAGKQTRELFCPSGAPEDCPAERLAEERACYSTSGCIWLAGAWGDCSSACGEGAQVREVACSSGADPDCQAAGTPPVSWQSCRSTEGCAWEIGAWSACSATCGEGLRFRSVMCPSGVAEDCPGDEPATSESCLETAGCSWQASYWSSCSSTCGSGIRMRSVTCDGASDEDCAAERPLDEDVCEDTSGCGWRLGEWSSCNSAGACGAGEQSRDAECETVEGLECAQPGPSRTQPCQILTGCSWLMGEWSGCSSTCGAGVRSRGADCSSGVASDCYAAASAAGPRPALESEACYATETCEWNIGEWGACSSTCGAGSRLRSVSCSSGRPEDCPDPGPPSTETCYETVGCEWFVGAWSDCSSDCGEGNRTRHVVCSGSDPADCAGSAPVGVQSCYATVGCAWQLGTWDPCSTLCGQGEQTRSVECPTGRAEDCPGQPPEDVQACHRTSACSWSTSDWSGCSSTCGYGGRQRTTTCSSGVDDDCSRLVRPPSEDVCLGEECPWMPSTWGACSAGACEGSGTRTRTLSCTAPNGDAGCAGSERPPVVEVCRVRGSDCPWIISEWSPCEGCGWGQRFRAVACSAGAYEEECGPEARPAGEELCYSLAECEWEVSSWSTCSASCGDGVQTRNVSCPVVCEGEPPPKERTCREVTGCAWETAEWGACDTDCGLGVQSREVSCSSGEGHDCALLTRPIDRQECVGVSGCSWTVGAWSMCSTLCGNGTQERTVTCSSGVDDECAAAGPRPLAVRGCEELAGCDWRASEWSVCSEICGEGVQRREVHCTGAVCDDERRPTDTRPCVERSGCGGWSAGPWAACDAACGNGVERREVRCSEGETCEGAGPVSWQHCSSNDGCAWTASEWSACAASSGGAASGGCGSGVRTRIVACAGGRDSLCDANSRPSASDECLDTSTCSWEVSEWSSCGADCRPQMREVRCSGGVAADACPLAASGAPKATRPCDLDACAATVPAAQLTLSLWLPSSGGGGEELQQLLEGLRAILAQLLGVPASSVSVTVVVDAEGGANASAEASTSIEGERRRASAEDGGELVVVADFVEVPVGRLALLAPASGDGAGSGGGGLELHRVLLEELVARGLATGGLRVAPASLSASDGGGGGALSWMLGGAGDEASTSSGAGGDVEDAAAPPAPAAASDAATAIAVVAATVAALCGASAVAFAVWRRRQLLYRAKIAPVDAGEAESGALVAGASSAPGSRPTSPGEGIQFRIGEHVHRARVVTAAAPDLEPPSPCGMTHQLEYDGGVTEWVRLDEQKKVLSDQCGHVNVPYHPEGDAEAAEDGPMPPPPPAPVKAASRPSAVGRIGGRPTPPPVPPQLPTALAVGSAGPGVAAGAEGASTRPPSSASSSATAGKVGRVASAALDGAPPGSEGELISARAHPGPSSSVTGAPPSTISPSTSAPVSARSSAPCLAPAAPGPAPAAASAAAAAAARPPSSEGSGPPVAPPAAGLRGAAVAAALKGAAPPPPLVLPRALPGVLARTEEARTSASSAPAGHLNALAASTSPGLGAGGGSAARFLQGGGDGAGDEGGAEAAGGGDEVLQMPPLPVPPRWGCGGGGGAAGRSGRSHVAALPDNDP